MSPSAPVRVRLRYADLETFVERFAANVTRGGVFIASRAPRPVGDQFPFEIQLANGFVALAGEGKVIWVKEYNPAEPAKAHGMGVQFLNLSAPSRDVLARMLKLKGPQRIPGAPRGLTQPHATLQARGNGTRARVDTSVDLAAEFGLDEATLRRALDRAWLPTGGRPDEDDLAGLLGGEASEPVTLAHVLKELPRMLDPGRRRTGTFRTLDAQMIVEKPPLAKVDAVPVEVDVDVGNGVATHAHDDPR